MITTDQIRSAVQAAKQPLTERIATLETTVSELTAGTLQDVTAEGNTTDQDIEITDATKGIILTAPDDSQYRLTIENDGTLTITIISV